MAGHVGQELERLEGRGLPGKEVQNGKPMEDARWKTEGPVG